MLRGRMIRWKVQGCRLVISLYPPLEKGELNESRNALFLGFCLNAATALRVGLTPTPWKRFSCILVSLS
jgi:hypothetical protein